MQPTYTLLIPTHYRHQFLRATLKEYKDSGIKIIVLDSTDTPFAELGDYPNVDYLHMPDANFIEKLGVGIKKVSTKYFTVRSDTRHTFLSGIEKCIDFLEKNDDYTSCHGYYFAYRRIHKHRMLCSVYDEDSFSGVEQETPIERMHAVFDPYVASFYATHRTELWRSMFHDCATYFTNYSVLEFYCAARLAIEGKIHRLPVAHTVTFSIQRVAPKNAAYLGLDKIMQLPEYEKERQDLHNLLTGYLAKNAKIEHDQAALLIDNLINEYLNKYHPKKELSQEGRFAKKIQKIWRKTFGFRKIDQEKQVAINTEHDRLQRVRSRMQNHSLVELDAFLKKDQNFR